MTADVETVAVPTMRAGDAADVAGGLEHKRIASVPGEFECGG
jgi:hypothetical protein